MGHFYSLNFCVQNRTLRDLQFGRGTLVEEERESMIHRPHLCGRVLSIARENALKMIFPEF